MEFIRNQSLRTKLVGVFLVPTLVIVLLYGLLAYFSARQGLEEELGKRLMTVGQAISSDLSESFDAKLIDRLDPGKDRVRERFRTRLREAREATDVKRLVLFNADFENLVDSEGPTPFGDPVYGFRADRYEINRTFEQGESTTSVLFKGEDGQFYKTAYVPITLEGEVVAALAVEASAEYFGLLRNFASVLTALGAVGIVLVVVAGTLFSRALTRPLNRLVDAARRLGGGNFEEPVVDVSESDEPNETGDDSRRDEIAFLSRAFEEMRQDILRRDRQMQMMLRGIAHEVKNPLGGMELFCGLLREDLAEAGDESALEKVDRIERELDYLDRVVDEFRDFARETELDWTRFSARELIEELESVMKADIEAAGCEFAVDVPAELELTADRDRIRRLLTNLVRNAVQACGEGDRIEMSAVDPVETPPVRHIVVRDDGPGISDEALEEMFTPFFTTKEKGSGLGLPLSKQVAEKHGGSLTIETEEGEGTEVTVTIPFDSDVESEESEVPDDWLG